MVGCYVGPVYLPSISNILSILSSLGFDFFRYCQTSMTICVRSHIPRLVTTSVRYLIIVHMMVGIRLTNLCLLPSGADWKLLFRDGLFHQHLCFFMAMISPSSSHAGTTRSLTDFFKHIRDATVDRMVIETNTIIIRLSKLTSDDAPEEGNKKRGKKIWCCFTCGIFTVVGYVCGKAIQLMQRLWLPAKEQNLAMQCCL